MDQVDRFDADHGRLPHQAHPPLGRPDPSEYGPQVFAIEVRTNTRLAEAPEQGMSIFQYDPRAKGAEAYRLLADEYLLRTAEVARRG